MTFKPKIWYPIAAVLSLANVAAVWLAAAAAEAPHATLHAAFGVALGLWALRLRQRLHAHQGDLRGVIAGQVDPLELEVTELRRELAEMQERLDFTERMLAQGPDPRRVDRQD